MRWQFEALNASTRACMMSEYDKDVADGRVYYTDRLSAVGRGHYLRLLREAIERGSPDTFAAALDASNVFNETEERRTKSGPIIARVPRTASNTLADGEFNRYYIRAICIEAGRRGKQVEAYRARASENPRSESEAIIGRRFAPTKILDDLRSSIGVEAALGVPAGPNSGISVRLVV